MSHALKNYVSYVCILTAFHKKNRLSHTQLKPLILDFKYGTKNTVHMHIYTVIQQEDISMSILLPFLFTSVYNLAFSKYLQITLRQL